MVSSIPAGEVRRDCEPHRGLFLQLLGASSMFLGLLSSCLLLPILAGVPLSVAVWVMARRDQEKMHVGLMDPEGKEAVEVARRWAMNGLVLCILSACLWGFLLYQVWCGLTGEGG
jgi:hypothetical protein